MSSKPDKLNIEENEKIKTQIDASIGMARSLISSWLPPPKEGETLDDEDEVDLNNYSTGRPDRLGLGAKFLSHAEAMRHNNNSSTSSKEELLLKNKILNQNRKATAANQPVGKRYRPQDNDDSESDEESRSTTVGVKQKKAKHKAAATSPTPPSNKKKIGNQGDFLSMYLNERAGKKKNKNKK